MENKKYQKLKSQEVKEKKKNQICRNDLQRKVFDIANQESSNLSPTEFWMFYNGFTKCLELNTKDFIDIKKLM